MPDPLSGKRNALNRGELAVIVLPDGPKCPLVRGYSEQLRSCRITIGKTTRKLVNGVWRWEAVVIRHVPDTVRIPASQHGQEHPQQYVKTSAGAVDGIGEEVPEDYLNELAAENAQRNVVSSAQRAREEKQLAQAAKAEQAAERGYEGTTRFIGRMKARIVGIP